MPPSPHTDHRHMHHALMLARRNLGRTWPNPSVGCVVVKDGQVVGRAVTAPGGRPHAEPQALAQAGADAQGATLYVTLEPCCHHGQTPPCTDAIIAAGIARVVIACEDPHPEMQGKSLRQLAEAGIAITTGVCGQEAREVNAGFFSVQQRGRPLVGLKVAASRDGRLTTGDPANPWITGTHARAFGQLLRTQYDAILTGSGTALMDNPQLTCRLPGLEDRSPVRILLDRSLRLPENSALLHSLQDAPLWIITSPEALQSPHARKLQDAGISLLPCPSTEAGFILLKLLSIIAEKGVTRLLVEAGPRLCESFLHQRLVDRLYWFSAPVIIGKKGQGIRKDIMDKSIIANPTEIPHLTASGTRSLNGDRLDYFLTDHRD